MTEGEVIRAIRKEVALHEKATPATLRLVEEGFDTSHVRRSFGFCVEKIEGRA